MGENVGWEHKHNGLYCQYCGKELVKQQRKFCCSSHRGYGTPRTEATKQKISNSMKGREIIWATKISKAMMGNNNGHGKKGKPTSDKERAARSVFAKKRIAERAPNWKGGISFVGYPPEFRNGNALKELVRDRDGRRCVLCGKEEEENGRRLDVHHVDYEKANCNPDNLVSLCVACNARVNANREQWMNHFRSIKQEET